MTLSEQSVGHLSADELLDYFERKLSEGREELMEEHLAACDACTRVAREVYAVHEALERWTAEMHGRVYLQELLNQGLSDAEERAPQWRERLRHWRLRWAGTAEAALRVVMDISGETARAVAEAIDSLGRPGTPWQLTPVPAAIQGDAPADQSTAIFTTAIAPDTPRARVALRAGATGEVTVRVDGLADARIAPLVLLVATGGEEASAPRVAQVERAQGADYFIARFRGVPPGEYLIAFEPAAGIAAAEGQQ